MLNRASDLTMQFIAIIVLLRHDEFLRGEHTTGFEHTKGFGVDALETGCVTERFDAVDHVESVVWERKVLDSLVSFGHSIDG